MLGESGIGNRESGIGNRESVIGDREEWGSGMREELKAKRHATKHASPMPIRHSRFPIPRSPGGRIAGLVEAEAVLRVSRAPVAAELRAVADVAGALQQARPEG